MTRKDRLNRIFKQEREAAHVNRFLNPDRPETDEQADAEEQDDRPAEQPAPAEEKAQEPPRGYRIPELTESRKRRIDSQDRRLRGQVSAYAGPY